MEIPLMILVQRSNYLKGLLCKYAGHFSKALTFFKISSEKTILCDAQIISQSLKQIIDLSNLFKKDIQSVLESNVNINPNNKQIKKDEKFLKIEYQLNHNLVSFEAKINEFKYMPKDVSFLIEINENMIENFQETYMKSVKAAILIQENYISQYDRFALFLEDEGINPVIGLTAKNLNTIPFVNSLITNILDKSESSKLKGSSKCSLKYSISLLNRYLEKKSNSNREKWIVIFIDRDFGEKDFQEIKKIKYYNENDQEMKFYLVVITLKSIIFKINLSRVFIIDIDRIYMIKKIFSSIGKVNKVKFQNEKLEAEKKYT